MFMKCMYLKWISEDSCYELCKYIKPIIKLKVTHTNCVTITSIKGRVKEWKTYVCILLTTYVHTVALLWYALMCLWPVMLSFCCWTERPVIISVQRIMTTDITSSCCSWSYKSFLNHCAENFQCRWFSHF